MSAAEHLSLVVQFVWVASCSLAFVAIDWKQQQQTRATDSKQCLQKWHTIAFGLYIILNTV
jgi:hypothetical protein